jgi:nucleotide-binding universal stress UspA family protein
MKKILVPTDFSGTALNATQYALNIAKVTKSELVFFHADEHNDTVEYKKLKNQVEKIHLSEPGIKISFSSTGKLFNALTVDEIFSREQPDLIIIGTNGESGLSKILFGTNSSEIINASCPVLVVPNEILYKGIHQIAYASDLNDLKQELEKVISFAKYFDADIEVFHVSPLYTDPGNVERTDIAENVKKLSIDFNYDRVTYHVEKMKYENQVNKGIEIYLEHHQPDLLVVFHQEKDGINQFFSSSYSEKLAAQVQVPLMVFPKI